MTNLVCPKTQKELTIKQKNLLTNGDNENYPIINRVLRTINREGERSLENDNFKSSIVNFYSKNPFPDYQAFTSVQSLAISAEKSIFGKLLRDEIQLKYGANILEVGCGTGQLSNYLAGTTNAHFYAADMTAASLELGANFAFENKIENVRFLEMDLFKPCIKKQSMNFVICSGVLVHAENPKAGFESVLELLKPGGFIIIGLYNKIGRIRTDFRRMLYQVFGERVFILDPHLRKKHSSKKREAWIQDQYHHLLETKHTINDVLKWFDEYNVSFISSIPKILGSFSLDEKLFEAHSRGTSIDRTLCEIGMLFNKMGAEGGLFIMIGKKNPP